MARLRFPGRPGYRFDRLGVRYGVDEGQRGLDPTTRLIANIHRGLKFFREHFGESDEEEEFSGFTLADIKQATKKYQDSLEDCQELEEEEDDEEAVAPRKSAAKRTVAALVSEGICREAPRRRLSEGIREEVKESKEKIKKLKDEACKPKAGPSGERRSGRPVSSEKQKKIVTTVSLDQDSPKKEKKKKRGKEEKPEHVGRVKAKILAGQAAKKKDRLDKAKILLAKAREDKKKKTDESKKTPKQFVLPTVSSRSSRKIKPSKRYIEEYVDYPSVGKKRPRISESSGVEEEVPSEAPEAEPVTPVVSPSKTTSREKKPMSPLTRAKPMSPPTRANPMSPPTRAKPISPPTRAKPMAPPPVIAASSFDAPVTQTVIPTTSSLTVSQPSTGTTPLSVDIPGSDQLIRPSALLSPRMGLFDQPLIVEGKRQRKPSIKLIRKITDEEYDVRTLENRRKIEERKTQEGDVVEMDRSQLVALERHAEATKRSGQNILRKAKFQLNRAALNRSKAALARQLKRKMKKEGQQGETLHHGQLSPGGFPKPQFGVSPIQLSPLRLGSFGQPLGIAALSTGSALSHKMTFLKPGTSPSPLFGGATCGQPPSKEGSFAAAVDGAPTSTTGRIFGTGGEDGVNVLDIGAHAGSISSSMASSTKMKKKKKKLLLGSPSRCAICNCECKNKKSTHGGRYLGVPSCEPCSRFYSRRIVQQIRDKVAFVCDKNNQCEITLESKASCVACRYNKCLAMFPLPKIVVLKELKNQGLDDEMCERALMEFERNQEAMKRDHPEQVPGVRSLSMKVKKDGKKEQGGVAATNDSAGIAEDTEGAGDAADQDDSPNDKGLSKEMRLKSREEKRRMKEVRKKERMTVIAGRRAEREARIKRKREIREIRLQISKESKLKLKEIEVERYIAMTDEEKEEFRKQRREYNRQWMAHKRARVKSEKLAAEVLTDLAVGPIEFQAGAEFPAGSPPPPPFPELDQVLSPPPTAETVEIKMASPEATEQEEVADTPPGRGPRIKHVCRKAAVALGTPATFPPVPRELRLSALPVMEKERILKKDELERPGSPDSDDMSMEEIIRRARDDTVEVMPGKQTTPKTSLRALIPKVHGYKTALKKNYKRKMRCKKCENCLTKPCGKCGPCLDSPAFGGRGVLKKACIKRECLNPILPMIHGARTAEQPLSGSGKGKRRNKISSDLLAKQVAQGDRSLGNISSVVNAGTELYAYSNAMAGQNGDGGSKSSSSRASPVVWMPEMGGKGGKKRLQFASLKNKKQNEQDSRFGLEPLRTMNTVQLIATQRAHHRLKPDFPESYDIDVAWQRGLSLISAGPQCVRTVCFLCGSAGKHKMLYCSVCCEPYHTFCLDEDDRPLQENLENWCCRKCQFCHVCGKRNRLLKCDKCQDTYHPECLGPNYPTRPSATKHIWICTKCVKCKSCGATTPGKANNATWTHDFSLCYECGRLMDKGNYCPMCHKCYADDDWDTKMIQCSTCDAWIHAKCEGLTDEKYQLLSYLPDEVTYNCRYCSPTRPAPWELMMKQEMVRGFTQVINAILSSKSSQHLSSIPENLDDSLAVEKPNDLGQISEILPQVLTEEDQLMIDIQLTADDLVNQVCAEFGEEMLPLPSMETGDLNVCETVLNEIVNSVAGWQEAGQEPVAMETNCQDDNNQSEVPQPHVHDRQSGEVAQTVVPSSENASQDEVEMNSVPLQPSEIDASSQQSESQVQNLQADSLIKVQSTSSTSHCDSETLPNSTENPNTISTSNTANHNTMHHGLPLHVDTSVCSHIYRASESTFTSPEIPDQPFLPPGTTANLINLRDFHDGVYNALMNSRSPSGTYTADELSLTSPLSGSCQEFGLRLKTNIKMPKKIKFKTPRLDFPRDIKTVRRKLQDGSYSTVEEFVDDLVRIIQFNLQEEEGVNVSKKKARNTVRGLFVKQMKAYFPWFNVETCNHWSKNASLPDGILLDAVVPPTEDHTYAQWMERDTQPTSPHPSPFKKFTSPKKRVIVPMGSLDVSGSAKDDLGEDTRKCVLCQDLGDQPDKDCGRLLYAGQNEWVHVNCALWSAEVYEEVDGSLQHVSTAYSRSRMLRCDFCGKAGATVGCCSRGCSANYHFMCARRKNCVFQEDKKVYCNSHRFMIDGEPVDGNSFAVLRRMCVEYEPSKWKRWAKGLESSVVNVLAGSLTVENLGKLMPLSDTRSVLCPVEFCATRVFWSSVDARRRAVYTCRIVLVRPSQDCQAEAIVQDRTVIHDIHHPDYDPEIAINWLKATLPISRPAKDKDPSVKCLSRQNSQDSIASQADAPTSDYGMPSFGAELLSVLQLDGGNPKADEPMDHDGMYSEAAEAGAMLSDANSARHKLNVGLDLASLATPTKNMIMGVAYVSEGRSGSGAKKRGGRGGGVNYDCNEEEEERYIQRLESDFKSKNKNRKNLSGNLTTDEIREMLSAPPSDEEMDAEVTASSTSSYIPSEMTPIPAGALEEAKKETLMLTGQDELVNEPVYTKEGIQIGLKVTRTSPPLKKPPYSLAALKKQQMMQQASSVVDAGLGDVENPEGQAENPENQVNTKLNDQAKVEINHEKDPLHKTTEKASAMSVTSVSKTSNVNNLDGHADLNPLSPASSHSSDRNLHIPPGLAFTEKIAHIVKEVQRRGSMSDDNTDHNLTSDDDGAFIVPQVDGVDDRMDGIKVGGKIKGQDKEMALSDKIAQKIKAESLARSSTGEAGPFKCPSCKRLYRTKESCEKHAVSCDFVVSSDEDEADDGDQDDNRRKSYPLRHSRRLASAKQEKTTPEKLGVTNDVKVVIDKLILHSDNAPLKRGRGRPPKNPQALAQTPSFQPTVVLKNTSDPPLRRGRGRPPKARVASPPGNHVSPTKSEHSGTEDSPIVLSPNNTPVKRPTETNSHPPTKVLKSPNNMSTPETDARRSLRSARVVLSPVTTTNYTKEVVGSSNSVGTSNRTVKDAPKSVVSEKGDAPEAESTSEKLIKTQEEVVSKPAVESVPNSSKTIEADNQGDAMEKCEQSQAKDADTEASTDGTASNDHVSDVLPSDGKSSATTASSAESANQCADGNSSATTAPSAESANQSAAAAPSGVTDTNQTAELNKVSTGKSTESKPRVERVEIVTTALDGSRKVICVSSENMCEELLKQGMPADMIPKLIATLKEKNLLKSDVAIPPLPKVTKPSSRVIRVLQNPLKNSPKNARSPVSSKAKLQQKTPERRIEPNNQLQVLTTPPNQLGRHPTIITSPTTLLQSPVNVINQGLQGQASLIQSQGGIIQNGQASVIQTMNPYSLIPNGQQIVHTALTSPVGIQTVHGLSGSPVQISPNVTMVSVGMATQSQISMGMTNVISQQPQVVSYSNYNLGGSLLQQQVPTVQQSIVGTGQQMAHQPTIVGPAQPVQDFSGRVQGYVIRTTRTTTSMNSLPILGNSGQNLLNTSPVIPIGNTSISQQSYTTLPSTQNLIHGIPVDYVSSTPEIPIPKPKKVEISPVKSPQVLTHNKETKPTVSTSAHILKSILKSQENFKDSNAQNQTRQINTVQVNSERRVLNLAPVTNVSCSITPQNGMTKAMAKIRDSKRVPTVRLTKSKAAEVMIKKKYFSLDRTSTGQSTARGSKRVIKVKQYLDHVVTYDSDSQESTDSNPLSKKSHSLTNQHAKMIGDIRALSATNISNLPVPRVSLTDIIKCRKENGDREPRLFGRNQRQEEAKKARDEMRKYEEEMEAFAPENESSLAHPMLHGTAKAHLPLPQPETEMEVADTPFYDFDNKENQPTKMGATTPDKAHLKFEITSDDGLQVSAYSWQEAWQTVIDKVQDARAGAHMKQLSFTNLDSLALFGLNHPAVVYLIEQLYGAHNCANYRFKYHLYEQDAEEAIENPTGAARCEPFSTRKPRDMFSFLLSQHRTGPAEDLASSSKPESEMTLKSQRRATSMDLPMAMRFRHLREHAKEAVGVYRSPIQGRGLFCKRDIDGGEMIIEYAGEVIRTALTDKREKYYDSRGIGSYMFRIDEYDCVDATMHGNAARFINHSCEPNCFSRVINVDNQKHIVIFAMRQIKKGEELTYDYKFPIEDVKVPCYCGARRCRKYLN